MKRAFRQIHLVNHRRKYGKKVSLRKYLVEDTSRKWYLNAVSTR